MSYKENYDKIDWSVPLPAQYHRPSRSFAPRRMGNAPVMVGDIPGYYSVASGKWIDGRRERREDLKRTGCVEAGDMPRLNDGYARSQKFAAKHGMRWEGDR